MSRLALFLQLAAQVLARRFIRHADVSPDSHRTRRKWRARA